MARPRPAGLHDGYVRYLLWVDATGWTDADTDRFLHDLLAVAVKYGKTAHVEVPLGLVVD